MELARALRPVPPSTLARRRIESAFFLGAFAAGVSWWAGFKLYTRAILEDALITFRYAQNLARGHGFVYNLGERVLGTTTPLLTLFLAAAGKLLGAASIPQVAVFSMLACGILTALLGCRLLEEAGFSLPARLLFLALYFGNRVILIGAIGGMETSLVLLCMVASALSFVRGRPIPCLCWAGILCLTRIDGVLWAGLVVLALPLRTGRIPWKGIAAFAALTLPWAFFAFAYFGSPLPNTIVAKQVIGHSTTLPPVLSRRGIAKFTVWFMTSRVEDERAVAILLISLVLLGFGVRAFLDHRQGRPLAGLLLAYVSVHGLFLHFGRAPYAQWYLAAPFLCLSLLMGPGLWSLAKGASRLAPPLGGLLEGLTALMVVSGIFLLNNVDFATWHRENQANEEMRRSVGEWLRDNTPPGSSVAMEAIGYQGYYSDRRIIDLAGLVSPKVVAIKRLASSNGEFFFRVLKDLEPDYIVLRSSEVDENASFNQGKLFETPVQRESFTRSYQEVRRFVAPYPERWGRMGFLTIYARRQASSP